MLSGGPIRSVPGLGSTVCEPTITTIRLRMGHSSIIAVICDAESGEISRIVYPENRSDIEEIARRPIVNTLRRIGGWLAPYRGRMVLALVLTTLACLFNLPVPLLVQELVDRVVTQNRWDALPLYAVALFGVFGVQAVLTLWSTAWSSAGSARGSSATCGTCSTSGSSSSAWPTTTRPPAARSSRG